MTPLKPHTPEWFAALERVNPGQAAMTRQVLSLAGRDDVCSTCGDEPSEDYTVADVPPPGSIRLCADCRDIRAKMYGERFTPFAQ